MEIKASELRQNLFSILDRCLDTGEAVEVPRKQGTVIIQPFRARTKVADLPHRPGVLHDGDALDRFSPSDWRP